MIPCHNQSSCFHLHSCHILLKVPPTPSSVPPGPSSHYCQIKLSKIYLCNAVLFLNISRLLQHQWHGAQVPWAAQPGPVVTCSCPLPLSCSCVRLFATPWTVACQAPLSMGFSRQEYWSGLPFPSPGHLPDTGIKPGTP